MTDHADKADPLVKPADSLVNRARELMGAIRYQIFCPEATTMGACPKCGGTSRGSGTCADCLAQELDMMLAAAGSPESALGPRYVQACRAMDAAQWEVLQAALGGGET